MAVPFSHRPSRALLAALAACAVLAGTPGPLAAQGGGEDVRVYDTRAARWVPWGEAARAMAAADVVFFGEQHRDSLSHVLELGLLEAVAARGRTAVVAMEMFERDVQPSLDRYLAGEGTEDEMREAARPWPNYESDYRPLVEMARERKWPLVASNVPRQLPSAIARGEPGTGLEGIPAAQRAFVAAELRCPADAYFQRFAAEMAEMTAHGPAAADSAARDAAIRRYFTAQCVKDETMAESVARARRAHPDAVVVHFNGAFHSDFRQGTVERAVRRLPGAKVVVLSVIPVADPAAADPAAERERADYLVFTREPAEPGA
jgi:uncharacterized iron-regulated protein